MFCKNCGKKLDEGLKFCGNCGEAITKEEIAEKVEEKVEDKIEDNDAPQQEKSKTATIKCGNCDYVGPGEPARTKAGVILAWLCVFLTPLITIIYFLATHKYRCPKCKSTFLGIKNKQGVFTGQRGGASRVVWIVVCIFVGIAIIGILASVVLASLNSARKKSRDARRVADIKQIQLALELFYDANDNTYPEDLIFLDPNFISSVPSDPLGGSYTYHKCFSNSYHLGASLEEESNLNLSKDKDIESMCSWDTVNGLDSSKCKPSDVGSYCYDENSDL